MTSPEAAPADLTGVPGPVKLPDARPYRTAPCSVCRRDRRIAWSGPDGSVCTICRPRQKVDTCQVCGKEKPCLFAGTPRAKCHECSKRKEPCSSCGAVAKVGTRTEGGEPLCKPCGRNKEPCSGCGRTRIVAARLGNAALCDYCYRSHPALFRDCLQCGRHEKLLRDGRCHHCTAESSIAGLFPADLLEASPQARSLHAAFLAGDAITVLRAFQRKRSVELLRSLLLSPNTITHDILDAAGTDQATRAVRSVLVEHGLLPPRDNNLARFEAWIPSTAALINDPAERAAFVRFARWRHLRELRQRPTPIPSTITASRRRELRIVLEMLDWARHHGRTLATLTQQDIDLWQGHGHRERHRVKAFLAWAHHNRLAIKLQITRPRSSGLSLTGPGAAERHELLNHILSPAARVPLGTRVAASLILLYGVRPHQITNLRLTDFIRQGPTLRIKFGPDPLLLPGNIAELADALCRERRVSRMISSAHDTEWLLPGSRPGYPLSPAALTKRLRLIGVIPTTARTGAMASLAQELPPVILARLTGLSTSNAIKWAEAVAASNSRYAASLISEYRL